MSINPSEQEEVISASPQLSVEEMKSFFPGQKGEPDKILIDFGNAPRDYAQFVFAQVYQILQNSIQDNWKDLRLIQSWPREPTRQLHNPYIRDN